MAKRGTDLENRIGIARTVDFGGCPLIGIVRVIGLGDCLLIGVVRTLDLEKCLPIGTARTIVLGGSCKEEPSRNENGLFVGSE